MAKEKTLTINCSKEDLVLSISDMMDGKFATFKEEIYLRMEDLETNLNQKMSTLETTLNSRMDKLESSLNSRMDKIDSRMDRIDSRMDSLESDLKSIKLTQENVIVPRLNNIEKTYNDSYFYYRERMTHIENPDMDIPVIKSALIKHGERISKLEEKIG